MTDWNIYEGESDSNSGLYFNTCQETDEFLNSLERQASFPVVMSGVLLACVAWFFIRSYLGLRSLGVRGKQWLLGRQS